MSERIERLSARFALVHVDEGFRFDCDGCGEGAGQVCHVWLLDDVANDQTALENREEALAFVAELEALL